jgi:DNA-binding GntR family transcriptional regulator
VNQVHLPVFSRAKPVRQLVYETLRQAICDGGFAPGTRLVEEELAEQLKVSRTPIREALRRLESEGLITHTHCKGATVLGFSRDDVIELYSIREALEALAIHYTIQHITRDEINQLKAIVDKMRANLGSKDVSAHFEWNQKFNDLLIETCKMPRLTRLINTYREHLHHFRYAAMGKHEGRMVEAFREHEQILHAIMVKDSVKAESLVRQHLQAAKRAYTSGDGAAERTGERSRTPWAAPDASAPRVLRGGGAIGLRRV